MAAAWVAIISYSSLATKIWLSIGVFVVGFVFCTVVTQTQGIEAERRLEVASASLFPAALQSQRAEAAFQRSTKAFRDAVVMLDSRSLERAMTEGYVARDNLHSLASIVGLGVEGFGCRHLCRGEQMTPPCSRKPRILFVDDEPDLLAALVRNLRSEHFEVSTAPSAAHALELLENAGPFAVIVSDLQMPGMDGIALLRRVRTVFPDIVRVLFTGQPDLENAIAAVNDGAIFRFVTKPCSRVTLALTAKAAVDPRLITAERELLQETLRGSIKALTDVLGLVSPLAFGRATRLRQSVAALARVLHVAESWHVEVAAMLSQIGSITLPPGTLERAYQGEELSQAEVDMMCRTSVVAEQILGSIPRLDPVLEILRCQQKHFDGSSTPGGMAGGEAVPWGARALKVALDLDILEASGLSPQLALDTLRGREGRYDPAIVGALSEARNIGGGGYTVRELPRTCLKIGMVLAQDLRTAKGMLFVARGQEVTAGLIEKLRNSYPGMFAEEPIRVVLPNLPDEHPAVPIPG